MVLNNLKGPFLNAIPRGKLIADAMLCDTFKPDVLLLLTCEVLKTRISVACDTH